MAFVKKLMNSTAIAPGWDQSPSAEAPSFSQGEEVLESLFEANFRALVEHAPEAIVVFDGVTGKFLFGNNHACRLYGVTMEKLTELTPTDVSPEFQPDGRRSIESAREKMDEALAGGMPVFEWI